MSSRHFDFDLRCPLCRVFSFGHSLFGTIIVSVFYLIDPITSKGSFNCHLYSKRSHSVSKSHNSLCLIFMKFATVIFAKRDVKRRTLSVPPLGPRPSVAHGRGSSRWGSPLHVSLRLRPQRPRCESINRVVVPVGQRINGWWPCRRIQVSTGPGEPVHGRWITEGQVTVNRYEIGPPYY